MTARRVQARAVFFKDADKLNHRTRARAFEDAQQAVAARYPEGTEATILYALRPRIGFFSPRFSRIRSSNQDLVAEADAQGGQPVE